MDTMTSQDDKLEKIFDKLGELREGQISLEGNLRELGKTAEINSRAIWGNGQPGLHDQVKDLKHDIGTQQNLCAAMQSIHKPEIWWKRVLTGIAEKVGSYLILAIIVAIFAMWLERAAPKVAAGMTINAVQTAKP